jgi:ABC-2 type transport system permease protein
MSLSRVRAIARHDTRLLTRDPIPLVTLMLMPLAVISFIRPLYRNVLGTNAGIGNGAALAVPGLTVLFAFFLVGFVGYYFFQEHGWNTWDRLRASQCRPIEIITGKCLPLLAISWVQFAVLLGIGGKLFGMHVKGSILGVALVSAALSICLLTLGVAVVAVARTVQQVNTLGNLGAIVLAGIGGAITPVVLLPGWARTIAPATPNYWAMQGYTSTIVDGNSFGSVIEPVFMLLAFTALFVIIACARLRVTDTKVYWS